MKVLLVDDHVLFVEALRGLLTANGFAVVGAAGDGKEALEQVRVLQPDIVLMDIHMPRCSGLDGTRLIKAEFPQVKVVILTMSANDDDLFDAIKSGASGYIVKDIKPREFIDLLTGVTRGEAAITREMATRIMGEMMRVDRKDTHAPEPSAQPSRDEDELTERQTDILRLVSHGHTYKEIAAMLSISERTVNYHMGEILDKLRLQNRAQVIAYAARIGLTSADPAEPPPSTRPPARGSR
jgi:DNA-binding NarL/FixJ family response regulator